MTFSKTFLVVLAMVSLVVMSVTTPIFISASTHEGERAFQDAVREAERGNVYQAPTPGQPGGPSQVTKTGFVPLAPIEGVTDKTNLYGFLNAWVYLLLAIAAILAVIMIMIGGLEYMLGEAAGTKESGKARMRGAVGGLILALLAFIILNTINQGILKTDITANITSPAGGTSIACYRAYRLTRDGAVQKSFVQNLPDASQCNSFCAAQQAKDPHSRYFCGGVGDKEIPPNVMGEVPKVGTEVGGVLKSYLAGLQVEANLAGKEIRKDCWHIFSPGKTFGYAVNCYVYPENKLNSGTTVFIIRPTLLAENPVLGNEEYVRGLQEAAVQACAAYGPKYTLVARSIAEAGIRTSYHCELK